MCNPMLIVVAASAAVSAYGAIQQGQAQAAAEEYNARVAENNAKAVVEEKARVQDAAAIERRRRGELARAQKGELTAKFSAMGVDPGFGTPADLIGDVSQAYNIDRSILGKNEIAELERLDKEEADYLDAAKMGRATGKSAIQAGAIQGTASLLEGASGVSSRWIQPSTGMATNDNAKPVKYLKVGGG